MKNIGNGLKEKRRREFWMNSLMRMGTIDVINKAIIGKEHFVEKAKRKDEEIVKKIVEEDKVKDKINIIYEDIVKILKEYLDMREDYYSLVAIWIMGTYFHKEFDSYPYLFVNAMRGSGKTRLLKLISTLSRGGDMVASMSEAVLFRTASEKTFCIDECESIGKREKSNLRELLNSAYKKGTKVKRMRKLRSKEGGEMQKVEEFDVYCPIAMANIWGMEEVLGDRCIHLVLEKSNKDSITKLLENFGENEVIKKISSLLSNDWCSLCSVVMSGNVYFNWNSYIKDKYITTLNTHTTTTTTTTQNTYDIDFYNKIDEIGLWGRYLELFFPLLIIANTISDKILDELLKTSKKIVQEKKTEEITESKDVMLIDFVSELEESENYYPVIELTNKFKAFLKEEDENIKWINSKWFGRALKRMGLIKEKRRLGRGVEVVPNVKKAKKQILIFKEKEVSTIPNNTK